MIVKIYPDKPERKDIQKVAEKIKEGGVVIIPTDSVYAFVCDYKKPKAVEKLARLKNIKPDKADFSFMFDSLSMVSEYSKPFNNRVFKLIKKNTPGPHTFIVEANSKLSKFGKRSKNTLGVRIPDNPIITEIVKELGHPLITGSVIDEDEIVEYTTDPSLIHERYENQVDIVVDGGYGNNEASTIADCTKDDIEIIREGVKPLILP